MQMVYLVLRQTDCTGFYYWRLNSDSIEKMVRKKSQVDRIAKYRIALADCSRTNCLPRKHSIDICLLANTAHSLLYDNIVSVFAHLHIGFRLRQTQRDKARKSKLRLDDWSIILYASIGARLSCDWARNYVAGSSGNSSLANSYIRHTVALYGR